MSTPRFVQIDRDGFFKLGETRVSDEAYGRSLLEKLEIRNRSTLTHDGSLEIFVEAYDEVLVAQQVHAKGDQLILQFPYGFTQKLEPATLSLDEWDRFHGVTDKGIPWGFSRTAQAEFFRLLEDFDDTSITWAKKKYEIPNFFSEDPTIRKAQTWDQRYQDSVKPGWDMGQANPVLKNFIDKLKLQRSRICVLGAGAGHDASFLADRGHIVTAVDFSAEAKKRFENTYPDSAVRYETADVFDFAPKHAKSFDLVFDHTCFCAIPPSRRKDLVKIWQQLLVETGNLLAIFFVMNSRVQTPYGASEWELEQRLKKPFHPLYWLRAHDSVPERLGAELLYYGALTKPTSAS